MDLEKIVFNKRQPTRRGTIIKNLLIILIILIVLIVFAVTGLAKLGKAANQEEWKEITTLLNKEYNTTDIVQFNLGELDNANLKSKLTSRMNAEGLYNGDQLMAQVLYNTATISQQFTLDNKDLTIITKEYLKYAISIVDVVGLAEIFNIQNVMLTTNGTTTTIRLVAKILLTDLKAVDDEDFGIMPTRDMPECIYITCLGTIDNTKTLKKCLISSNIIINNLSSEDNTKVLQFFLEKYNSEISVEEFSQLPIQYFLDSLHTILGIWNSRASFESQGLLLNTI